MIHFIYEIYYTKSDWRSWMSKLFYVLDIRRSLGLGWCELSKAWRYATWMHPRWTAGSTTITVGTFVSRIVLFLFFFYIHIFFFSFLSSSPLVWSSSRRSNVDVRRARPATENKTTNLPALLARVLLPRIRIRTKGSLLFLSLTTSPSHSLTLPPSSLRTRMAFALFLVFVKLVFWYVHR